jgi:hypothetical protein
MVMGVLFLSLQVTSPDEALLSTYNTVFTMMYVVNTVTNQNCLLSHCSQFAVHGSPQHIRRSTTCVITAAYYYYYYYYYYYCN